MNPLEFLKYTPKNNCGDCGQPSCLAFAVTVTKGGAAAKGCPHLDPSMPLNTTDTDSGDSIGKVERMQEQRDLELVRHLKSKVSNLDFKTLAPVLGAKYSAERGLLFFYLGQEIEISGTKLRMAGEEVIDPRDQILLYNYISYQGGPAPKQNWIGLESLPNSISKVRTLAASCETRLAERFSTRPAVLQRLCQQLDGQPGSDEHSASVGMIIPVLPRLPHYLLFWDGEPDDGFDAKVKVLFDRRVMDFLDLESLVFTAERLAERLAELDEQR